MRGYALPVALILIPTGAWAIVRAGVTVSGCTGVDDCPAALAPFAWLWAMGAITIPLGLALAVVTCVRARQ